MLAGFSTGSLALADFRRGLQMATHERVQAIELSALREAELDPLLDALDSLQKHELQSFRYVSFHAPSRRESLSERELVAKLKKVASLGWAIIVHPDVMHDLPVWHDLGSAVCIENMDKRKSNGRTAIQLQEYFDALPDATFCFDIGHARQVDPSMQEAMTLVRSFRDRLRQVHMSFVNSQSCHERLNFECFESFRKVLSYVSRDIPIILETPTLADEIDLELDFAESILVADNVANKVS